MKHVVGRLFVLPLLGLVGACAAGEATMRSDAAVPAPAAAAQASDPGTPWRDAPEMRQFIGGIL